MKSPTVRIAIAGARAILPVKRAFAQVADYPSRNVTVIAPSAPGGLFRLFAQLIATELEHRLRRTFVVENKPGT
ncbi:MAG: hypothetical protein GEU95_16370 [Rhizobiales bacterium]|nr:hypothetical protein [Hyphomicrobiales bacterium]